MQKNLPSFDTTLIDKVKRESGDPFHLRAKILLFLRYRDDLIYGVALMNCEPESRWACFWSLTEAQLRRRNIFAKVRLSVPAKCAQKSFFCDSMVCEPKFSMMNKPFFAASANQLTFWSVKRACLWSARIGQPHLICSTLKALRLWWWTGTLIELWQSHARRAFRSVSPGWFP